MSYEKDDGVNEEEMELDEEELMVEIKRKKKELERIKKKKAEEARRRAEEAKKEAIELKKAKKGDKKKYIEKIDEELASEFKIVAENIHKTYLLGTTAVAALRGVDLRIKNGEFVVLMGPSGSGKTTLLNLIGGLDTPTRGKIFLEGQNISMLSDNELADIRRDKIGYVFQFYNLLPQMTALENVMVPLHFSGKLSRRGKRKRAMDLLSMVGLEERAHHTPSELSGGEQQRVAIARAFANDPAICVLDEPTGDLDSKTGHMVMNLLRDLNKKGATFIAVTHDAKVAEFGQRTLHMLDGKVVSKGKIEGLKETETMKQIRMSEAEANKSKCETKIFQYLFSNQGQTEFKLSNIRNAIPKPILDNIPIHFDDIVVGMIKDEKIPGKIEGQTLILA
jgi:putative ABC transport system ATP-binding protein